MKLLAFLVVVAACSSGDPPAVPHDKPSAPVDVTLTQRRLDDTHYEITLAATALRDVPDMELGLDGRKQVVGAVRAGETRTTTTIVSIGAVGRTIAGGAAVTSGRHRRNKAATIDVGTLPTKRALPTRIITMPDGTLVEEVRP